MTDDEDKQDLEDFGLDHKVQVSGPWANFAAQVGCYRLQIVFVYSCGLAKTIRKRYHVDANLLKTEKNKLHFQTKTDTCDRA